MDMDNNTVILESQFAIVYSSCHYLLAALVLQLQCKKQKKHIWTSNMSLFIDNIWSKGKGALVTFFTKLLL